MPAVSAPAACGVPFPVIEAIVMAIHQTGKVRAADLAEFNPTFDRDNAGARSAARLAYRLLGTPCHV
jgi:formiminoglutamase